MIAYSSPNLGLGTHEEAPLTTTEPTTDDEPNTAPAVDSSVGRLFIRGGSEMAREAHRDFGHAHFFTAAYAPYYGAP